MLLSCIWPATLIISEVISSWAIFIKWSISERYGGITHRDWSRVTDTIVNTTCAISCDSVSRWRGNNLRGIFRFNNDDVGIGSTVGTVWWDWLPTGLISSVWIWKECKKFSNIWKYMTLLILGTGSPVNLLRKSSCLSLNKWNLISWRRV